MLVIALCVMVYRKRWGTYSPTQVAHWNGADTCSIQSEAQLRQTDCLKMQSNELYIPPLDAIRMEKSEADHF